jgi:hypothetical protein
VIDIEVIFFVERFAESCVVEGAAGGPGDWMPVIFVSGPRRAVR